MTPKIPFRNYLTFSLLINKQPFKKFLPKKQRIYDYISEFASEALHIVIFENFVKSMTSCLSKLKVTPSFCFTFKIPDDPTATNIYRNTEHSVCIFKNFLIILGKGQVRSHQWIKDANLKHFQTDEQVALVNFELDVPPGMDYLPHKGAKYLAFFSSCSLKMREK